MIMQETAAGIMVDFDDDKAVKAFIMDVFTKSDQSPAGVEARRKYSRKAITEELVRIIS
jgi:hypothetical protein